MTSRPGIENTLSRYALGYDDHHPEMIEASFTKDAVLSMKIADGDPIGPFEGIDAIMELMNGSAHAQSDQRRHLTTNILIDDLDAEHAKVVSYLSIVSVADGALTVLSCGKYEDEFTEVDGTWLISKRHIALDLPY
ncbi:nuclear transport factor 2 family protein [Rhodococcus sp. BP-252]|uniref:SnoaL-like domain-containing protein n=1 Tax=Rhodococcoides kyotonense TaxID=398843 RepID=A0A177YLV0_9NOCA|nr:MULTISPECIES: nuclear transport factor 2 family protein [Rhodococcus]MBY6412610.1 nuclear transport factor 2 family protein [Rhodococcus sp. BP-320]MBY6417135.1 nuclear transport factor 2 family protein [Rhodococcus sp. BP-321]MBY6423223.1 nuclear transport factor 2 family protein [Rhodococcus sp. BP-324]MBY6427159.1 nuclear transport factor 2 family protein [Rhodococcus sp. BP-323]MBY6432228.1 nuclear transport factor 2 family protein [Rhodococcus sp. BP-322]